MRCWNPTYKCEETRFFGGRKIIFRKFEFWRIAVPAVLDNRPSRLLEFRHADETGITTRHSGRAPSDAAVTGMAAGKPRGAVRT
jgi:hypothetical protein